MMQTRPLLTKFLALLVAFAPMRTVAADPCGMVPPIQAMAKAIQRIGVQQTYVCYRAGIETLVLRPGFTGSVEQFGMLIPFPSPPSVRKVPDDIFAHIAAAIDPPEVLVNLGGGDPLSASDSFFFGAAARTSMRLRDEVRVLREEAVGMYEVAVLEAGSAAALKRWMEQHGYRYPDGMDKVCDDYVAEKWCFVAVKTRVGSKTAAAPRPGMRRADATRPAGSSFDGHVQAMGFRFRTDELVVPMRLSTFNSGGDPRNIVYLLAERGMAIRNLPATFVKRQVPGWKLLQNVTQPLPLRLIGGKIDQLPPERLQALAQQQDPGPRNGFAKELFFSDLEAARLNVLEHRFEEREKRLLHIGEELGLRGSEIDAQIAAAIAAERDRQAETVGDLVRMTLTVIDGPFAREVLARENLGFVPFAMAQEDNHPGRYDAKVMGPEVRRGGVLTFYDARSPRPPSWPGALLLVASLVALVVVARRRPRFAATTGMVGLLLLAGGSLAAQEPPGDGAALMAQLEQLVRPGEAPDAVEGLVALGRRSVPGLLHVARGGDDLEARGWALVALGRIGGKGVDGPLAALHDNAKTPDLVRTWAAAARVHAASTAAAVMALQPLLQAFPAVRRPFGKRLVALLRAREQPDWMEDVLAVAAKDRLLQQALAPAILEAGAAPLVEVLTGGGDDGVRRLAAGFLGGLGQEDYAAAAAGVVAAYRFDVEARALPWRGGALFVPALAWQEKEARALVGQLLRWHLWSERKGDTGAQKQIHNNLRSLQLASAAGYQSPGWQAARTAKWLEIWGKVVGADELEALLTEQGVAAQPRYRAVLDALR